MVNLLNYSLEAFDYISCDLFAGANNDAGILKAILSQLHPGGEFLQPGDHCVVDRGFRDAIQAMKDKDLHVHMPELVDAKSKQFTTSQANESRRVTLVRWLVEAVNGRIKKKFKFFKNTVCAGNCLHVTCYRVIPSKYFFPAYMDKIGVLFKTACALINKFCVPLMEDSDKSYAIGRQALRLFKTSNELQQRVATERLDRNVKSWVKASSQVCVDFPLLSMAQLEQLTLGVYQIRLARKYTKRHFLGRADYEIHLNNDVPGVLRVHMKSRFGSNKLHKLWIQYDGSLSGPDGVEGWYCTCKQGARTVGTCAHITSVRPCL